MKLYGTRFAILVVVVLWSGMAWGQQPGIEARYSSTRAAEDEVKSAQIEVDQEHNRVEAGRKEIEELRSKIREESGVVAAEPEGLRQLVVRLEELEESMEVEDAGSAGRQAAIVMAIDKTSIELKKRAESNDVTAELKMVVEARQKQLERIQQMRKAGVGDDAEVQAAEAAVATARAELAASRQRAVGTGSETLDAWNHELMNLTIAGKERESKLQFIRERLKRLEPALADSRELEQRLHDQARAERWLDAAIEQLRAAQAANGR